MDVCALMFRIFFLVVLQPCDAEVRVNLTAVVGSSIKFPDPVNESGFFTFGPKTIAFAFDGDFKIVENIYLNRLKWSSSGHFTLSDLKKSDSGVYTIDSKKGTVFSKFYELKIYDPVSAPKVSCVNIGSFSLRCSVNQTEQTTLQWFKGDQPLNRTDSGELLFTDPPQEYYSEYKCVARNPAETKNITVKLAEVCNISKRTGETISSTTAINPAAVIVPTAAVILCMCVCVCLAFFIKKKKSCLRADERQTFTPQEQVCKDQNQDQLLKVPTPAGGPLNMV